MAAWLAGCGQIGWIYGSVTEDILTGFKMHCRGWRSVYCMPRRVAFKGSAPINLSDRLQQVRPRPGILRLLHWAWLPGLGPLCCFCCCCWPLVVCTREAAWAVSPWLRPE